MPCGDNFMKKSALGANGHFTIFILNQNILVNLCQQYHNNNKQGLGKQKPL